MNSFQKITEKYSNKIQLLGDDLLVTKKKQLQKGIDLKAGNAILLKVNQIVTITETLETIKLAKENNVVPVVSHRSGETTDATIAHLAVGLGSPMIKTGAIGGERIAKLNELIRIEEELPNAHMASF